MAKKRGTSAKESAHRRAVFIEAYIANGGIGSEAAIAAGFSAATAKAKACSLLKEPKVAAAVAARRKALQEAHGLTTERVLLELRRIALSDPRKLFDEEGQLLPIHELGDDAAAAVASFEVEEIGTDGVVIGRTKKLKAWDKVAALEKAMKHLGMFEKDNAQAKQSITIIASPHDVNL